MSEVPGQQQLDAEPVGGKVQRGGFLATSRTRLAAGPCAVSGLPHVWELEGQLHTHEQPNIGSPHADEAGHLSWCPES